MSSPHPPFRHPPSSAHWLPLRRPRRQLTAREIQVLQFIGAGCTSRQIGDHMRVSHKTVENHKQRIFGKLGVQNQAHAVSVAFRKGYLRPEDVRTLADAQ